MQCFNCILSQLSPELAIASISKWQQAEEEEEKERNRKAKHVENGKQNERTND